MPVISQPPLLAPKKSSWTAMGLWIYWKLPDIVAVHVKVETETVSVSIGDLGTN